MQQHASQPTCTIRRGAAAVALALASASALAAEGAAPAFSFNGFATLGLTHSSEKNADFVSSSGHPHGAGRTASWSPAVDSRVGGQVTATFGDRWTAVLQLVAEQNWDKSYTPKVEWANVQYAFTPDFKVRVGRMVMPQFLFSDTRKVGYAMTWARPPAFTDARAARTSVDGIEAAYRFQGSGFINTVSLVHGQDSYKGPNGTAKGNEIDIKNLSGVINKFERGDLTVQALYLRSTLELAALKAVPVPAIAALGSSPLKFYALSLNYNPGDWFVQAELATTRMPVIGKVSGGYVTGGYRLGNFMPFVSVEKNSQRDPVPFRLSGPADVSTIGAGVRWDVATNVALKAQYDHVKLGTGAIGPLVNIGPGFKPGGAFNVATLTADFVF